MKNLSRKSLSLILLIYILILLFPALFINLGLYPFILDEATRANVAMEMIFSGNYITPTINGEFYYNKPPLFNWILIAFTQLTGNYSEFTFRLPVVLSLLFFALTVYLTLRRETGRKTALLASLALVTCGRLIFYDSLKGLIDISFSWIIYLQFWSIYHYFKKKDYYSLFIVSYLFTSLAFLMKGLPALVFQGISLFVFFVMKKKFRMLFSVQHITGAMVFLILAGAYFLAYNMHNPLENYFEALWSESSKRTFLENSFLNSISHLFTFPFEFIYHFLPWTFFAIILLKKEILRQMWKEDFNRFLAVIFLSNIIIYWLSPAIYARYLFMFLPLFFGFVFRAYYNYEGEKSRFSKYLVQPFFIVLTVTILLLLAAFPFFVETGNYEYFALKYTLIWLLLLPLPFLFIRLRSEWPFIVVALLLISRIAFNFFVIPDRIRTGTDEYQKNGARVAAEISTGVPLYLYKDTRIQHVSTYYIERERRQILKRWYGEPSGEAFYIVEKEELPSLPQAKEIFTFETRIEELKLSLVKFNNSATRD